MAEKLTPRIDATEFNDGDGIDFHKSNLEQLRTGVGLAYELTDTTRGGMDGATVISLAERRIETIPEPLGKVQEVGVSSKNIQTMRAYRLSQEAGQPTDSATILPFVRRRSPKTTSDTQDLDSQAA